jgi:hypothetical protein
MIRILLFLVLGSVYGMAFSQTGSLTGKVIDQETNLPILNCHIFIPNSSFQTYSDSLGNYILAGIPPGKWAVHSTKEGYTYIQDSLEFSFGISIELPIVLNLNSSSNPKGNALGEKKNDKLLAKLEDRLFTSNPNFSPKILNPESVFLESLAKKTTVVSSLGPIYITIPETGYLVTMYPEPFLLEDKNEKIKATYSYFELPEESVDQLKLRQSNRLQAFENSPNAQLIRLISGEIEGFNQNPDPKVAFGNTEGEYNLRFNHPLETKLQNGKTGSISYRSTSLPLRINGAVVNENQLILGGAFTEANPIFSLPQNFNPEKIARLANLERNAEAMQERVYVHTDKSQYWQGEHLFFKAYLSYGNALVSEELSRVLHVEIHAMNGKIEEQYTFKIENGMGFGQIPLPDDLIDQNYLLRAYTSWGLNYGGQGEFFLPIQVLNRELRAQSESPSPSSKQIGIFTDKQNYGSNESVKLNIMATDSQGRAVNANLSVSVLDLNHASPRSDIRNMEEVLRNSAPLKDFDVKNPVFPIETGITLEGKLKLGNGVPAFGNVTLLVNGYTDIRKLKSESNGGFILNEITYEEPFELSVQAVSREGIPIKNISLEVKNYPVQTERLQFSFPSAQIQEVIPLTPEELRKGMAEGEILMEEAVIETNREKKFGPMPYGFPDNVIEVEDLILNGDPLQFLNRLASRVPGMTVGGTPTAVKFRGGEPLVLINGIPARLAGEPVINILSTINVFAIDKVEVVKRLIPTLGDQGRNGVISIFLKTGLDYDKAMEERLNSFQLFKFDGLRRNQSFGELMKIQEENPILKGIKPTLYWNPTLVTDRFSQSKSVEFKTGETAGPIWVEIRGISETGEILTGSFLINEQKK